MKVVLSDGRTRATSLRLGRLMGVFLSTAVLAMPIGCSIPLIENVDEGATATASDRASEIEVEDQTAQLPLAQPSVFQPSTSQSPVSQSSVFRATLSQKVADKRSEEKSDFLDFEPDNLDADKLIGEAPVSKEPTSEEPTSEEPTAEGSVATDVENHSGAMSALTSEPNQTVGEIVEQPIVEATPEDETNSEPRIANRTSSAVPLAAIIPLTNGDVLSDEEAARAGLFIATDSSTNHSTLDEPPADAVVSTVSDVRVAGLFEQLAVAPVKKPILSMSAATAGIKGIAEVGVQIAPTSGEMPPNVAAKVFAERPEIHYTSQGPSDADIGYYWESPTFCHRSLYFEQTNLERYGRNAGIFQPAISAAHFFVTAPTLPYQMALYGTRTCCYHPDHGYDCAPREGVLPPWNSAAGLVEAGAITGLIFLIP